MRKPLFRRLILASEIDQEIMFFHTRFLDLLFIIVFWFFFLNCWFWDPLLNPMGAKMAPKSPKLRKNDPEKLRCCSQMQPSKPTLCEDAPLVAKTSTFHQKVSIISSILQRGLTQNTRSQISESARSLPGSARSLPGSARNLPRISWSTIESTHLPHIHWPRNASQDTNCQAPERGGGGDRPLAAFNKYMCINICV